MSDCDSHAGNSLAEGWQPLHPSALHPCSWPPAPPPASGPATGALAHAAAHPGAAALARSPPPAAQPQGPASSRGSGSRGPEETAAARHFNLHAAGGNAAAFSTSATGPAQPGLPGWPGQRADDQLVTACIKVGWPAALCGLCGCLVRQQSRHLALRSTLQETAPARCAAQPALAAWSSICCCPPASQPCSCLAPPPSPCHLTSRHSCRWPWH